MPELTIEQARRKYNLDVVEDPDAEYKVIGFNVTQGPSNIFYKVLNKNGEPVEGVTVVQWNEGAQSIPNSGWRQAGIVSFPTKSNGVTDVAVGGGSYYFPKQGESGPHEAWMYGDGVSDKVIGLGMVGETEHEAPMTVWQATGGAPAQPKFPGVTIYDYDGNVTTESFFFSEFWRGMWYWNCAVPCYKLKAIRMRQQTENKPREPEPVPMIAIVKKSGSPEEGIPFQMCRIDNPEVFKMQKTDEHGTSILYFNKDERNSLFDDIGAWKGGINRRKIGIPKEDDGIVGTGRAWANPDRWFDLDFEWVGEIIVEPPENLRATQGLEERVELAWDMAALWVEGYNLYRNGIKIMYTTNLAWVDEDVEPGVRYSYRVSSWDQETERESELSDPVIGWAKAEGSVPDPVQNLHISYVTSTSLTLDWDKNEDAYTYKVQGPAGEFIIGTTFYNSMGLEPETTYCYLVSAGNENGWSAPVEICGETLPGDGECGCKEELVAITRDLQEIIDVLKQIEQKDC